MNVIRYAIPAIGRRVLSYMAILLSCIAIAFLPVGAHAIPSDCTTPPEIVKPVHAGTRVIAYRRGTDPCEILIFANGTQLFHLEGSGQVWQSDSGEVELFRPLKEGETIIAKQSIDGTQSKVVIVESVPSDRLINNEKFLPPTIPASEECQQSFWVEGLIEGGIRVNFELSGSQSDSGAVWTPYSARGIGLSGRLEVGDTLQVSVVRNLCL